MKEKIGVQKDCEPLDKEFRSFWSWRCKCGEWNDVLPTRMIARIQYRKHRENCSVKPLLDKIKEVLK